MALAFGRLREESKVLLSIRLQTAWVLLDRRRNNIVDELLRDDTISVPVMRTFKEITAPNAAGHCYLENLLADRADVPEVRLKLVLESISAEEEHD